MGRHSELLRLLPKVLPGAWRVERVYLAHDMPALHISCPFGLTAFVTIDPLEDSRRWLHMSISRPDRYPSWDDIVQMKNVVIGKDNVAVQLLPKQDEYINLHQNTMHIWHCLEGDTIPPWG